MSEGNDTPAEPTPPPKDPTPPPPELPQLPEPDYSLMDLLTEGADPERPTQHEPPKRN